MVQALWIKAVLVSLILHQELGSVHACGATTHQIIAHRTLSLFNPSAEDELKYRRIIEENQGYLQAGAAFPDFLYLCGKNHNAGEFSHWEHFQAAAAHYLRQQQQPWSPDIKGLAAFMFGVVSHSTADVLWHGLIQNRRHYGFINALGAQDYGCYGNLMGCNLAHTSADFGGDFVGVAQTDAKWGEWWKWDVPADHLVKIFDLAGVNVTASSIKECSLIFGSYTKLLRTVGPEMYEIFGKRLVKQGPCIGTSEWMMENYLHYPFGGIDDMAMRSMWSWRRLVEWIRDGPPDFPKEALASQTPEQDPGPNHCWGTFVSEMQNHLHGLHSEVSQNPSVQTTALMNATWAALAHTAGLNKSVPVAQGLEHEWIEAEARPRPVGPRLEAETLAQGSSETYLYRGLSLTSGDYDRDGFLDLAKGGPGKSRTLQPQVGSIEVGYRFEPDKKLFGPRRQVIEGQEQGGRTGWSLTSLDFNLDGYEDLVAGSPSYGFGPSPTGAQASSGNGSVFVFFGGPLGLSDLPNVSIQEDQINGIYFGIGLSTAELSQKGRADLIVMSHICDCGGRERGGIWLFAASKKHISGTLLRSSDAQMHVRGKFDYEWFGFSVVSAIAQQHLVVGSPGFGLVPSVPSAGRVSLVDDNGMVQTFVIGSELRGHFGCSLALGTLNTSEPNNILAIGNCGAPRYQSERRDSHMSSGFNDQEYHKGEKVWLQQAGSVHLLSMTEWLGHIDEVSLNLIAHQTLHGRSPLGRFGTALSFIDIDRDGLSELAVSAPFENKRRGAVAIHKYNGYKNWATCWISGTEQNALFGFRMVPLGCPTAPNPDKWSGVVVRRQSNRPRSSTVEASASLPHRPRSGRIWYRLGALSSAWRYYSSSQKYGRSEDCTLSLAVSSPRAKVTLADYSSENAGKAEVVLPCLPQ